MALERGRPPARRSAAHPAREPLPATAENGAQALFPALASASGAFTFGIEVLWTRSFALVIGSSVYAFA